MLKLNKFVYTYCVIMHSIIMYNIMQLAMEIGRYSSAETTGQPVESDDVLYIEISAKTGQHVKEVRTYA